MTNSEEGQAIVRFFKALGDETRLRSVALLSHGALCVCHLVEALELPQSTVSRQLAVLRNAGIVTSRREGTWVYYALAEQDLAFLNEQLKKLKAQFAKGDALQDDLKRLARVQLPGLCC